MRTSVYVPSEFAKIRNLDPVCCEEVLDLIGGLHAEDEKIRKKKFSDREKHLWRRGNPDRI